MTDPATTLRLDFKWWRIRLIFKYFLFFGNFRVIHIDSNNKQLYKEIKKEILLKNCKTAIVTKIFLLSFGIQNLIFKQKFRIQL